MKEVKCVNCGDTVCVPQRGETVTRGETPIAHIERTGHLHLREPQPWGCVKCDYLWMYAGDADRPTCPQCKGKQTLPIRHFS